MEMSNNRLVIIGNGFDLAHSLKTSYADFISWYFDQVIINCSTNNLYEDSLISIKGPKNDYERMPKPSQLNTLEEKFEYLKFHGREIKYKIPFFGNLVRRYTKNGWVDIESYYYRYLKSIFLNISLPPDNKLEDVNTLNIGFEFLTDKLIDYLKSVNYTASNRMLPIQKRRHNLYDVFFKESNVQVLALNFNYTDTLINGSYVNDDMCLFIHGRVSDIKNNPIVFGYGDESDPEYQKIEDSGENIYLRHMKSFCYFFTDHYQKLLRFIESGKYDVYIVGHSCGLSDRVLLRTIFEHINCESIEIFYHKKNDGSDNFREITQEISRHFRPQNKDMMRGKVKNRREQNVIPQII